MSKADLFLMPVLLPSDTSTRVSRLWGAAGRLTISFAVLSTVLGPVASTPASAADDDYQITLPIDPAYEDQVRWTDSWGAPRSGGRSHIGVDMMGDRMIPLVAANDGEITWGRFDNDRGTIVRFRDSAGWEYQYIHINNDTPGTDDGQASCAQALSAKLCASLDGTRIRRGTEVKAGEFIGFLGDSGNAEWTAPHLHFEIYAPDEDGEGVTAVNPTPYVDAARIRARNGSVEPVGPFDSSAAAADEIYRRLEGRSAGTEERNAVRSAVDRGGLEAVIADVASGNPTAAQVDRLYLAFFQRPPDADGWDHWIDAGSQGNRLEDIAEWFAESDEFRIRYGHADFSEFLDLLYEDVLGRTPDEDGKAYWLDALNDGGVTRGTIVVYFTESAELRSIARWRSELTIVRRALGEGRPSDAEVAAWRELRATKDLETAISGLLAV